MFCAAAIALLAVSSCGKIWDEFDSVHGEIDNLKAKVEALEKKLNDEVATLNTKIGALETAYKAADAELLKKLTDGDAALAASLETLNGELDALDGVVDGYITSNDAALKAAIEEYKKADEALKAVDTEVLAALAGVNVINVDKNEAGDVVITFADKSTVTVPANPATGIVTVVDGQWAVVVNGEVTPLEAEVNPDTKLAFKVVENILNVSYDGGETWVPTGAVVNDDTTINVVEGFEYNEGDPYLTLTVGGKEYTLPVYKADTSSLVLGRTDFFLRYEGSKKVELKAEGIEEYYVMSKPDGWKTSVEGTTLTVTAPTKAALKIGAAEAEGEVIVHGTTTEGKCKIAKIDVTTGEGLTIDIDAEGNVTIKNAYTSVQTNEMMETETFGFTPFAIGIMPAAEYYSFEENYSMTLEEAWNEYQQIPCQWGCMNFYNNRFEHSRENPYVEGEYEIDVIETTMYEILRNDIQDYEYEEFPYGSFVVFVASANEKGLPADGVITAEYVNVNVTVEVTETTHNTVMVKVVAEGADSYLIGGVDQANYLEGWMGPQTFDEYMTNESQMGMGPWAAFAIGGYPGQLGQIVTEFPAEAFEISPYVGYGEPFTFDSSYDFWVMPMFDHMAKLDMTQSLPDYGIYIYTDIKYDYENNFKPYVMTVKTNALVAGEDKATMELDEEATTYSKVVVNVTPVEDAESIYSFYKAADFDEMTEEDLFADLVEYGKSLYSTSVNQSGLNPGDAVVLAVMTITADGKYTIVDETFYTKSAPSEVDETLTVDFGTPVLDYTSITVTLTPSAGTIYWKYMSDSLFDSYETDADLLAYVLSNGKTATAFVTCKESNLTAGDARTLVVAVLGENGKYNLYKDKRYETKSYPYSPDIKVALDGYMTYDEDAMTCSATFKVEGAEKLVAYANYGGARTNFVNKVMANGGTDNFTGSYKFTNVVDGKASLNLTGIYGDYMVVYVTAYIAADGTVTALAEPLELTISDNLAPAEE